MRKSSPDFAEDSRSAWPAATASAAGAAAPPLATAATAAAAASAAAAATAAEAAATVARRYQAASTLVAIWSASRRAVSPGLALQVLTSMMMLLRCSNARPHAHPGAAASV